MKPLTERQAEVLVAVRELCAKEQGPTLADIGQRVGMRSTWTVRRHLDILERHGFIRPRHFKRKRDIALIDGGGGALAA